MATWIGSIEHKEKQHRERGNRNQLFRVAFEKISKAPTHSGKSDQEPFMKCVTKFYDKW